MHSDQYLNQLEDFLTSPLPKSLFAVHPNDAAEPSFAPPPEWEAWWDWAASTSESWIEVVNYYMGQGSRSNIPEPLSALIDNVRALQLTRSQGISPVPSGHDAHLHEVRNVGTSVGCTQVPARGMSPKKLHEVSTMTAHIVHLFQTSPSLKGAHHVVDIGAGQGYLSWSLRALGMHVLALDSSATQAKGAQRQGSHSKALGSQGSLTYQIATITPNSLLKLVDEWITDLSPATELYPPPVVFVALHACGSLATDILHTSVLMMGGSNQRDHDWSLGATFIVGCCYNMMEQKDFPLCSAAFSNDLALSSSHLQLAAQVPSTWLDHKTQAALALRKVSWRALLEVSTIRSNPTNDHHTEKKRLGRVSNTLYQHWDQFLQASSVRLHRRQIPGAELFPEALARLEKQISTLHTLRCLLGPCVESLIIWDRYVWLKEASEGGRHFEAYLLNLFDQRQASGRNVLITMIAN